MKKEPKNQATVIPPNPFTKRGQTSFIEVSPTYLLYFNGPTVILRPHTAHQPVLSFVHKCNIVAVKFNSDFTRVASIDESGTFMSHYISDKPIELITQYTHEQVLTEAKAMDWTHDSKKVAIVGGQKDKFCKVIDVETKTQFGNIIGITKALTSVSFRTQKPYKLALGGEEYNLKYCFGPPYEYKGFKESHKNFINQIKYNYNGLHLVSVGSDRKIVIYNGVTFDIDKQIQNAHQGSIYGVTWIDNQHFITCSADKKLKKWNFKGEKLGEMLGVDPKQKDLIDSFIVAVSSCQEVDKVFYVLLSGQILSTDKNLQKIVKSYEGSRGKLKKILPISPQKMALLDFNGKILITSLSQNKTIRVAPTVLCNNRIIIDGTLSPTGILYFLLGDDTVSYVNVHKPEQTEQKLQTKNQAEFQGLELIECFNAGEAGEVIVGFSRLKKMMVWKRDGAGVKRVGEEKLANQPVVAYCVEEPELKCHLIFVGSQNGFMQIFSLSHDQSLKISHLVNHQVSDKKLSCFAYEKKTLYVGQILGGLKPFSFNPQTKQLKILCHMGGHTGTISSIILNSSEQFFHTFATDKVQLKWKKQTFMNAQQKPAVHSFGVLGAVFVGNKFVTFGGDYLVKVQDL